jgi:enamine deaminase RidA (YjgF/YER057c/UK114 family)
VFVAGFLLAALGSSILSSAFAEPTAQQSCPAAQIGRPGVSGKTIINPPSLPDQSARGYSHGVREGNLIFMAGQTGTVSGPPEPVNLELQTRRVFEKIQTIVEAGGGSLDELVAMTVFLTDMRYADEFTRLRAEILGRDFPGSAVIGVHSLVNPNAVLEVQSVAVLHCQ